MRETFTFFCLRGNVKGKATVEAWEEEDSVKIGFQYDGIQIEKIGENFFETLVEVRKELEQKDIKLLCKGCSRNVYPSAMALSMGAGRKAYAMTMGSQAKMDSLVDIFSDCSLEEYASINEQYDFFKEWCASLASTKK